MKLTGPALLHFVRLGAKIEHWEARLTSAPHLRMETAADVGQLFDRFVGAVDTSGVRVSREWVDAALSCVTLWKDIGSDEEVPDPEQVAEFKRRWRKLRRLSTGGSTS